MEVKVQPLEEQPNANHPRALATRTYTVSLGKHRMNTVFTTCEKTAEEWLTQVLKNPPPSSIISSSSNNNIIVVGFTATIENTNTIYDESPRSTTTTTTTTLLAAPYNLFSLCAGNQCLMYSPYKDHDVRVLLRSFFSDPRVVVVAQNNEGIAKKLKADNKVEFQQSVDVKELAARLVPEARRKGLGVDQLTNVVFGDQSKVPRSKGNMTISQIKRVEDMDEKDEEEDYLYDPIMHTIAIKRIFQCKKMYHLITSMEFTAISALDVGLLFLLGKKLIPLHTGFDPVSSVSNSKNSKKISKKKTKGADEDD